jgi:amino-acid N-acetyltransferase
MPELAPGVTLRRATVADVAGIAGVMAGYVEDGSLLPRSTGDLYRSLQEFHVAVDANGRVLACAGLRVLWDDLGEVRSLAVRPEAHGQGLGKALVARVLDDAREMGIGRVIALTREVVFFERCGFTVAARETMPRKVWTDCVVCPRRHACDEIAVEIELIPGALAKVREAVREWNVPLVAAPAPEPAGGAASAGR